MPDERDPRRLSFEADCTKSALATFSTVAGTATRPSAVTPTEVKLSEMETTPSALSENAAAAAVRAGAPVLDARFGTGGRALEEAVEYVLSDCFLAVGQSIGMRTTVDYDAIVWWHDHFRTKFLAAMCRHGDRWLQDREAVIGVGWMLAQRAVRHAAGRDSSHVEAARRAAADVQRYCALRSGRAARARASDAEAGPRLAGIWCRPVPY